MQLWEDYLLPASIEETLVAFADYGASASLIAGGTDLLIDLQEEDVSTRPAVLIDVTAIPDLQGITVVDDVVRFGAAVTHAEIIADETMRQVATALVEGCQVIGGPQVRNVATVGGNVAHALPAADGTLGLMAFDAEAEIATLEDDGSVSRRWVPLPELFAGPGHNTLIPYRELIVAFRFQAMQRREGSAFRRIMRPQGIALPIMGLACSLGLEDDGETIAWARVAPGPIAPVPSRAPQTEAALVGQPATTATFATVTDVALQECHPRTSKHRATSDYRRLMISHLLQGALSAAADRARTGEVTIGQSFIGERGVKVQRNS